MPDRLHPVRLVHQHLRRAASLLEQGLLDAATAEVKAALTIDPASLTARALEDKIKTARRSPAATELISGAARDETPVTAPLETDRFIPYGVDAQTWLGFEDRIQARRFAALMETVASASRAGDLIGARLALEEARELRPGAPELDSAEDQLSMLPVLAPVLQQEPGAGNRVLGAVGLLACGVALLVGLDAMRSGDGDGPRATPPRATPVATAAPPREITVADRAATLPITVPTPLRASPVASDDAVGTAGVQAALAIAPRAPRMDPVVRPVTLIEPALPPVGEVPDDYVAPASLSARDLSTSFEPVRPPAPEAPLTRDSAAAPVSTTSSVSLAPPAAPPALSASASTAAVTPPAAAPPAATAAAPPPAAAAIVAPRVDEQGVTQALNQYARAYARLDASAARAVWPSVDERALARAFAGLESQNVSFDRCDIDVRGTTANASCRGQASYVGKVGGREPRTEPRQWRFELRRDGDAWKIESAEARRVSSY